jgi:AraC-like DNA-binding protein
MQYHAISPPKELADLVSNFWIGKKVAGKNNPKTYYAVANTQCKLIFAFKSRIDGSMDLLYSVVEGQTGRHAQYPALDFDELLAVSLWPGAMRLLFGVEGSALNGRFFTLERLIEQEGRELNKAIRQAACIEARMEVVIEFLKTKLAFVNETDSRMAAATREIVRCRGEVKIEQLAGKFNLSEKQFERRFKKYSGFCPKLYSRIVRFESVLQNYRHFHSLTKAAYATGYYDQSHLNNDFKKFAGFNPMKYFALTKF